MRLFRRLLIVAYHPDAEQRGFLDRAETKKDQGLEATVSALSDRESRAFFGVRLARHGIQPVWIRVVNRTAEPVRLDLFRLDPQYYTSLEAAYASHFSISKHLLSYGLLAWFLTFLLPLVAFKTISARRANRRMDAFFQAHGLGGGLIAAGEERSGFAFTTSDEGFKRVVVSLIGTTRQSDLSFSLEVPGIDVRPVDVPALSQASKPMDRDKLIEWLATQARATTNKRGNSEGDPLNLTVVGDATTVLQSFGLQWDLAEAITFRTSLKTARSFVFDSEYRYSPVSPLYHEGRMQDLALQRARASIDERIHLRLWLTGVSVDGRPVWIGQVSRDIGVRFTPKTWNLTTHKIDPDVDEARDYVIDSLRAAGRLSDVQFVGGVGEATPSSPRRNLTGDPYFTDGMRAVLFLG